HPPSARQKRFNRLVARQRWVIEQSFGTLKGLFHGEVSTKLSDTANVRAESARVSTRHPRAGPENGETPESRRIRINSQQSLSILISITSKMTSRIAKIR
ncbi:MAG: transposase, partial [Hyphomonadaceae bacterium]|nr:transposase [Hyphomonadaceae bacterium]